MSFANSSNSFGQRRPAKFLLRSFGALVLLSLLNLQAASADPDLPGAAQNLVLIPAGSLIIPMDNALQAEGLTAAVGFNLKAYGLANKMLQNNVPMSWAIRYNKPKIRGIVSVNNATCGPLTSTTNFTGVQLGDLVTNVNNGMARARVTAVPTVNTLTLAAIGGDVLDCDIGDEFVVDGADFSVNAARVRPTAIAAANVFFAGGPFIISNAVPQHVTKALNVALTKFSANASESAVTMYQTTADANIDIRYALQHKPFAAISDWNTFIHSEVMVAAGIPGAACTSNCGKKDAVYVNCTTPGTPGFDPNTCNWNQVNPLLLATLECATVHLEPHRDDQLAPATVSQVVAAVNAFVAGGGNFLAECHATQYFENADLDVPPNTVGKFVTQFGVADNGTKGIQSYPNAPMAYSQMTGPLDGDQGGSITSWTLNGGAFINNGYVNTQLITNTAVEKSAASKVFTSNNLGGNVMYLGGHEFKNNTLQQINGRRMTLNSLFIPPDRPFQCGLSINAALVIVKKVVNDNGGAAVVGDFGIDTDATANPLNFGAGVPVGDETTYTADTLTVLAGQSYTLTENDVPGYTEGTWSCVSSQGGPAESNGPAGSGSVDLPDAGVTKTCTITNNDQPTQLTLRKVVVNDNGGNNTASQWTLNATGSGGFSGAPNVGADPLDKSLGPNTVTAGVQYTLSESGGPAGYSGSAWSCTGGTQDDNKITLVQGANVTCTITNNDQAASLTIVKQITNDNGGTAAVGAFGITTSAGLLSFGAPSGTTTKTYTATALPVDANTPYTLVENDVAGYTEGTWSCTGGNNLPSGDAYDNGSVTLVSGGSKTCTIINNDIAPKLTLQKLVVNDGNPAGTNEADDWTLTATGSGGFSGTPTGTATDASLGPNNVTAGVGYALSESATPTGYTATSFGCDGGSLVGQTITLAVGDDVTCQVTNDDSIPDLNLAKTVKTEAALQPDGKYKVVYTITATNTGQGAGTYNLNDLFSPGTGITVSLSPTGPAAVYVPGTDGATPSGTTGGVYPAALVTGEGLAAGKNESWTVTAFFTVDPTKIDETSQCDGEDTGFYNYVDGVVGGESVLTDNDACSNLPPPDINLAKTVKTAAALQGNGTYTVVYTITATNNGQGPGYYDLDDLFSPGTGITLNTATAAYVAGTESTQSGDATGVYPAALVTGEGLAAQKNESWTVTANFTVDPTKIDGTSQCDGEDTGFYNYVDGVVNEEDTDDNDACSNLPPAIINLAKTVNGPAVKEANGSYTVVYTITASNSGNGPGYYDLDDVFSPGSGITLTSVVAVYVAGTESTQSGDATGVYPAALVTGEALAGQKNESWQLTANFAVVPAQVSKDDNECNGRGTGFYNYVSGSSTETDFSDNDACTDLELPSINTTFRVLKHFTDGNPMDVEVKINCFTGLPLTQTQQISENRDVVFVVHSFKPGTLDCDIAEVVPQGYTPTFDASADELSGTPGIAAEITEDSVGCHFEDVESGAFICSIVNTPLPVDLIIEKKWIIDGTGGDQVNQKFSLKLYCDTYIEAAETGEFCYDPRIEPDVALADDPNADPVKPPIACSLKLHGTGNVIFTEGVVPQYPNSHCYVEEHIYDDAVEVDNGCKDLVVSAGQGDSCLITNTVFFEGIPTLNQYGMVLLALLMLGIGMVGFRRFV